MKLLKDIRDVLRGGVRLSGPNDNDNDNDDDDDDDDDEMMMMMMMMMINFQDIKKLSVL